MPYKGNEMWVSSLVKAGDLVRLPETTYLTYLPPPNTQSPQAGSALCQTGQLTRGAGCD